MEPGNVSGTNLTHKNVPLKGATGKLLAKEALDVLEEFDSVTSIKAILLDNTAVNTGADNGLVTWLETLLDRKLLTIGCACIKMSFHLELCSNTLMESVRVQMLLLVP